MSPLYTACRVGFLAPPATVRWMETRAGVHSMWGSLSFLKLRRSHWWSLTPPWESGMALLSGQVGSGLLLLTSCPKQHRPSPHRVRVPSVGGMPCDMVVMEEHGASTMTLLTEQVALRGVCPRFPFGPGSLFSQTRRSASLFLRLSATCCLSQEHHSFETLHSTMALVQVVCSSSLCWLRPQLQT